MITRGFKEITDDIMITRVASGEHPGTEASFISPASVNMGLLQGALPALSDADSDASKHRLINTRPRIISLHFHVILTVNILSTHELIKKQRDHKDMVLSKLETKKQLPILLGTNILISE